MKSKLPIRYVIIEGPDLSGKSRFIQSLHKTTNFKYNIQDRSCLSMLCYARLYGRDVVSQLQFLKEELSDLNNFFVVMVPPEEILLDRLTHRGDEFQDASSIIKLRQLFEEEAAKIQFLPNVLVVKEVIESESLAAIVKQRLDAQENSSPAEVGDMTNIWSGGRASFEAQLQFKMLIEPDYDDSSILDALHEGEYYREILEKCCSIINNEIKGINQYKKSQDLNSRRFYFSSDTCIASIHFLPRDGKLTVLCTLRSTDVKKNGIIDTRFLAHLSTYIPRKFNWDVSIIDLHVNFNSAHVR